MLIGAALNQHDRSTLYPFGDTLNEGFLAIPNARALPATLDRLAALGPSGPTNLRAALHRLGALRLRRGMVAIVYDFFDPAGIDALVESLHGMPHKLLLVQLCRESDARPQLDGELSLVDCETGHDLRVTVTATALKAYSRAYADFQDKLLEFAGRRRTGYITLDADGDVIEQFMNMFGGGVITTRG